MLSFLLFLGLLPLISSHVLIRDASFSAVRQKLDSYILEYPSTKPNADVLKGLKGYNPPDRQLETDGLGKFGAIYKAFSTVPGVKVLSSVREAKGMTFDMAILEDKDPYDASEYHIALFDNYSPREDIFVLFSTHGYWVLKSSADFAKDVWDKFEERSKKERGEHWTTTDTLKTFQHSQEFKDLVKSQLMSSDPGSLKQFKDRVSSQGGSITRILWVRKKTGQKDGMGIFSTALKDQIKVLARIGNPRDQGFLSEITWRPKDKELRESQQFLVAFFYSQIQSKWEAVSLYGGNLGFFTLTVPGVIEAEDDAKPAVTKRNDEIEPQDEMDIDDCDDLRQIASLETLWLQAHPLLPSAALSPAFDTMLWGWRKVVRFEDKLHGYPSGGRTYESAGLGAILVTSKGLWTVMYPAALLSKTTKSRGGSTVVERSVWAKVKRELEYALQREMPGASVIGCIALAPTTTNGRSAWGTYQDNLLKLIQEVVEELGNGHLSSIWVIVSTSLQFDWQRRLMIETEIPSPSSSGPMSGIGWLFRVYYGGELQFEMGFTSDRAPRIFKESQFKLDIGRFKLHTFPGIGF